MVLNLETVSAHLCFSSTLPSATKRTGSWYKLPGLSYVAYIFVFPGSIIICRFYRSTLLDQASLSLQLRVSLSDLVYKDFYPV